MDNFEKMIIDNFEKMLFDHVDLSLKMFQSKEDPFSDAIPQGYMSLGKPSSGEWLQMTCR